MLETYNADGGIDMSVRVEKSGRITTIVLDRPEAKNAIDRETGKALAECFLAFERDRDAAVGVFWGAYGAFCAGADLKELASTRDLPSGPLGPSRLELTKPVIAAISGPAVAGGMELALWCDLRVMEEDAYFGVYCRRWGVPLIYGGTVRLPRLVGEGRALDIILTGRNVTAEEALRIGMCERVVGKGQARQAAEELAREIARFPQECVRADRNAVRRQSGINFHDALRQEYEYGLDALRDEGLSGAVRFAKGLGRHGSYSEI